MEGKGYERCCNRMRLPHLQEKLLISVNINMWHSVDQKQHLPLWTRPLDAMRRQSGCRHGKWILSFQTQNSLNSSVADWHISIANKCHHLPNINEHVHPICYRGLTSAPQPLNMSPAPNWYGCHHRFKACGRHVTRRARRDKLWAESFHFFPSIIIPSSLMVECCLSPDGAHANIWWWSLHEGRRDTGEEDT